MIISELTQTRKYIIYRTYFCVLFPLQYWMQPKLQVVLNLTFYTKPDYVGYRKALHTSIQRRTLQFCEIHLIEVKDKGIDSILTAGWM